MFYLHSLQMKVNKMAYFKNSEGFSLSWMSDLTYMEHSQFLRS
jgi:hypothetical protein